MNPLHPRIIVVWHLAGLLAAVFLAAAVGAFEHWVLARKKMTLIAPGVLTG